MQNASFRGAVKMDLFSQANNSRLFSELQHIFQKKIQYLPLEDLADFELFQFLWPDLLPNLKTDRRFLHILSQAQQTIAWFILLYLEETIDPWRIYLLSIMARSRPKQIETFCIRFQVHDQICRELIFQKVTADTLASKLYGRTPSKNSTIRRMLAPLSNDGLLYLMTIARKKEIKQIISLYVTSLRDIQPLLNGDDMISMGYQPGEKFREMFSTLRDARLDGKVADKEDEKSFLLKKFPL